MTNCGFGCCGFDAEEDVETVSATKQEGLTAEVLAAMEARWRGFSAPMKAFEDSDGDWWIATEEDDSGTGDAMMTCDCAEELATAMATAGPDVLSLLAEVRRLTAALDGARREGRERAAKVCDDRAREFNSGGDDGDAADYRAGQRDEAADLARAIRALPDAVL